MNSNQENLDLISLWKSQDAKLDKIIELNQELIKQNINVQAKSALKGIRAIRWIGIITGILFVLGIGFLLYWAWPYSNWFFRASLIIIGASYLAAIILYIYHLILLWEFDNSQSIAASQEKLTQLINSNLKTIGILWLVLPAYATWFITDTWLKTNPSSILYIQVPIVIILGFIGIWLFMNFDMKSVNKKWFQWFMTQGEFAKIAHAQDLLSQLKSID